jgi:hypothetical protein
MAMEVAMSVVEESRKSIEAMIAFSRDALEITYANKGKAFRSTRYRNRLLKRHAAWSQQFLEARFKCARAVHTDERALDMVIMEFIFEYWQKWSIWLEKEWVRRGIAIYREDVATGIGLSTGSGIGVQEAQIEKAMSERPREQLPRHVHQIEQNAPIESEFRRRLREHEKRWCYKAYGRASLD